jgi:mannose-6-phosphate isomerase-like protein (cupin superfamily)
MRTTVVLALTAGVVTTLGCSRSAHAPGYAGARGGAAEMQAAPSFHTSLRQAADLNDAYRRVLFTGVRSQIALMTIPPGGEAGTETTPHVEQLVFVSSGQGKAIVGRTEWPLAAGDVVVFAPGAPHDILNTGVEPLRLITTDTPPRHMDGVVHATREAADADVADKAFGAAVR